MDNLIILQTLGTVFKDIPGLNSIHWTLAYIGLSVHILMDIAEAPDKITKKNILLMIASALAIPAILIICTDSSMKDILPINYVTSFLAGYQTTQFLQGLGNIGKKYNKRK